MSSFLSVLQFVGILLLVLLVFNLLIIVHELGHFLAAKWRGLYIERFGIWFGKPIWEKKINGIWYSLGSIPAGGFVKLPQLAPMEALEGQTEIPKEQLKPITPLDKIIVAFAGPLFSFLLAVVFAVIVWQVGRPVGEADRTTTIGYVDPRSAADNILQPGDVIKAIDGVAVDRWGQQRESSVVWRIVASEGETIKVDFERGGVRQTAEITPKSQQTKWHERRGLRQLGVSPRSTPMVAETVKGSPAEKAGLKPNDLITHVGEREVYDDPSIPLWAGDNPGKPIPLTVEREKQRVQLTLEAPKGFAIGEVFPDSPASRAGIRKGDIILSADGKPMPFSELFVRYILTKEEQSVTLAIERKGKTETATVKPEVPLEGNDKPSIGIGGMTDTTGIIFDQYGRMEPITETPGEQISAAVGAMVQTYKKITSPKSSIGLQHMGGPVMMMRIYYLLFESPEGWRMVLWFSVLLNVNLALLNMLPLPVLDGGHITLAALEAIRRKPINTRLLEWVQTACALLIIGFMLFVTFFDVQDVFGGGGKKTIRFKPATEQHGG